MLLLSQKQVKSLITMPEIIDLMRDVFRMIDDDRVKMPERTVIEMDNGRGSVLFMPCAIPEIKGAGIKTVSFFPENGTMGLPSIRAMIQLFDPDNGNILCLMDGTEVTTMRTAAVSALATDLLAKKDSKSLAVYGCGVQGRSHIEAISVIRSLEQVFLYDKRPAQAEHLAEEMIKSYGSQCRFSVILSPDAVPPADILVTATNSHLPVFNGSHLKAGVHINGVGAPKPSQRELDDTAIKNVRIFVDTRIHSLAEAGDLLIPIASGLIQETDIVAELGELVTGKVQGRTGDQDMTFFKSVGLAAQDIIVARRIFDNAIETGDGMKYDG